MHDTAVFDRTSEQEHASAACEHVVVIATIGRPQLQKALRSVDTQHRPPVRVIVCVDGDQHKSNEVAREIKGLAHHVEVVKNDRTRGAAGAWNTALDQLTRSAGDPDALVVSFLDDDDWWEDTHLEEVHAAVAAGAEVVATTIVRHDEASPDGVIIEPPAALTHGDFLRGNPGIQGSNLSARLSTLLHAGLFDEALRSCTDRDICIRLADLGVRYQCIRAGRVHHDACGRDRLSTPGSEAKQEGLSTFYAKHAWRMTPAEEAAFLERGQTLFAWAPSPPPEVARAAVREIRTTDRMTWIVAAIVDSGQPARALPFVDDVARLAAHPRVEDVLLVLLQNGPEEGFARVLEHAGAAGLRTRPISEAECRLAGARVGLAAEELEGHKSIAAARSVLQQITHDVTRDHVKPVVWITDDDVRLPPSLDLLVDDVARARATGMDAAIGMVAGAPPVPAATTLRTQLVDLVSFLRGAAVRDTDEPAPDALRHNARWRLDRRDYYYDLVRRQTDRLETPFLPWTGAESLGAAVAEVAGRAKRMLAGEQIFRPVQPAEGDPLAHIPSSASDAEPSLVRGGNTFVFNVDLLRDAPNLSPRIGGRRVRRSDTLWALLARYQLHREVRVLPIFVAHDRSHERPHGLDPDKMFDDVLGYAFSRALEEHLKYTPGPAQMDDKACDAMLKRVRKLSRERMAELHLSCFRIRGLARAVEHLLDAGPRPSGLDDAGEGALRELTITLRETFAEATFQELARRVQGAPDDRGFKDYLRIITSNQRIVNARRCCEARLGAPVDEVLGMGAEGVLFRVDDRVLKVFDRWSEEHKKEHLTTLHALAERPAPHALPRVLAVHDNADPLIAEMEWEPSDPYTGGRGPELVELLRALRASGWACSNVHPKNLRVTPQGLRIVDVGRSLLPFSAGAEEHVARRALLSMRCADHPALDDLMSRSITDPTLAELVGVEHLLGAVRGEDPKVILDETIAAVLRRRPPGSVLDFGCGKPRAFHDRMAGTPLVVFDPDAALGARWGRDARPIPFLDEAALEHRLASGPSVDAVVCSLVLCSIDGAAMVTALQRIRRLIHDSGAVIVAVCDPRSVHVEHTGMQRRFLPQDARYERSFSYVKQVIGAGARVEHHRPLLAYRRAFFRAGFDVQAEQIVGGIDTDRFVPVAEFVIFELRPRIEVSSELPSQPVPAHSARPAAGSLSGLTVLSYHRVADERAGDPALALHRARGMVVSRRAFEVQMRALARHFQPVRLDDVRAAAIGRTTLPHRAAWVTFDDGYRDILDIVAPVLEREHIFATLFTRAPCHDGLPSWAPLDLCYQVLARAAVPDPCALVPQGEARERLLAASYLDQMRWVMEVAARHRVNVSGIFRRDVYLSMQALEALRSFGFSIGAHGTEHTRWTTLDDGALKSAIAESINWLDRSFGDGPLCVAYPDAAVDRRVASAAAMNGFTLGVILEAPGPEGVDPRFAVRRLVARDDERWIDSLAREREGR